MLWPEARADLLSQAGQAIGEAAIRYHWINPHVAVSFTIDGFEPMTMPAYDSTWRKWLPKNPPSAHWYDVARLKNLIAKTAAHADDHGEACPTVAAFLADFHGLSGTAKRRDICADLGINRLPISSYVTGTKSNEVPRSELPARTPTCPCISSISARSRVTFAETRRKQAAQVT